MSYSSYDHDDLEPASTMRIERRIYFESGKADLSEMVKLPLAELLSLRAESAAAEQEVFDRLKEQATAWEEQAGRTLFLDKALEYARTLPVTHTANQWEAPDEYRHIRSNMVYQMDYSISENTRYDSAAQKSVPYSWTLRWGLYTNAPHGNQREKIAGQDRKVFASREELDKYLNGRIKAHDHYFTEISPAIPKEYADCFKVNGCLLPGYTIEGEEPAKAAALPAQKETAQPQQTTATPERREPVNEVFSIFLDNRTEALQPVEAELGTAGAQPLVGFVEVQRVVFMVAGHIHHRHRPVGKQRQAEVRVLHLVAGLVGPNVPGQHQQVGSGGRFRAKVGVHFEVQVGHQLDIHGVCSLNHGGKCPENRINCAKNPVFRV